MGCTFTHVNCDVGKKYKDWLVTTARRISEKTGRRKTITDLLRDLIDEKIEMEEIFRNETIE